MVSGGKLSSKSAPEKLTLYEQLEQEGLASLASMEGVWSEDLFADTQEKKGRLWLGVSVALLLTVLAWWLHQLPIFPFTIEGAKLEHPIGFSILAILLGMLVANVAPVSSMLAGCRWITRWCIPIAVVLLGASVDLTALGGIGWKLFGVIIVIMLVAMGVAYAVGRSLGMSAKSCYLLGVGTAVCGSSAILAVSPVSGADDEDVVISVGVVNLVGLLAMFTCAATLWAMPLNAEIFGAWAGVSIHAVPQVIAAAESHGGDAVAMATLVKLTRVTLLAPLVLLTALWVSRSAKGSGVRKKNLLAHLPWFVWGFMVCLLYTSPSPRDQRGSRMPSSA